MRERERGETTFLNFSFLICWIFGLLEIPNYFYLETIKKQFYEISSKVRVNSV